jgi:hypothetical protein
MNERKPLALVRYFWRARSRRCRLEPRNDLRTQVPLFRRTIPSAGFEIGGQAARRRDAVTLECIGKPRMEEIRQFYAVADDAQLEPVGVAFVCARSRFTKLLAMDCK